MTELIVHANLRSGNMRKPLNRFSDMEHAPFMQYRLEFKLPELGLSFVRHAARTFYTGDIREKLDRLTDGFFTALYGDVLITGYAFVSQVSRSAGFGLEVLSLSGEHITHVDDFNPSTNDIEYLYDRMAEYEEEHKLPDRVPRYSVRERVMDDLWSPDLMQVQEPPIETYEAVLRILQKDMADCIIAQRSPDDGELLYAETVAPAFWQCLLKRLQHTERAEE